MNPIENRVAKLQQDWLNFVTRPDARLLHWVIEPDEWRLLEAFFRVEEEDTGVSKSAFVRPEVPFHNPVTFGVDVRGWLIEQYAAARVALANVEDSDPGPEWIVPAATCTDDVEVLHDTLKSFHEHHSPVFEYTTLVLAPTRISNHDAWQRWVGRAVMAFDDPALRLIAPDYRETLALRSIAESHAKHVFTVVADLNLPAAYEEISEAAGQLDAPHGAFRHGYLQMSHAIGRGDTEAAARLSSPLERIALREGWLHLAFATHFVLGSGYLGKEDVPNSIRAYRKAEEFAIKVDHYGEDFGRGLQLKARLGMGAACVVGQLYGQGAEVYESAAEIAAAIEDNRMLLESLRMASYCREQDGQIDLAWEVGMRGLPIGEAMDEPTRRTSTLAHLGAALLRLTDHRPYAHYRATVDTHMAGLLGEDWLELTKLSDGPIVPSGELEENLVAS